MIGEGERMSMDKNPGIIIFAPSGSCCVNCPLNIFHTVLKTWECQVLGYSIVLGGGYLSQDSFRPVTQLKIFDGFYYLNKNGRFRDPIY